MLLLRSSAGPCSVFRVVSFIPALCNRSYHVNKVVCAGQNWRVRHGQSRSGNEYGPLTDRPDWTFVDGRPPVQGKGQLKRQNKQFGFSRRIRRLLQEMDAAKTTPEQSDQDHSTTTTETISTDQDPPSDTTKLS